MRFKLQVTLLMCMRCCLFLLSFYKLYNNIANAFKYLTWNSFKIALLKLYSKYFKMRWDKMELDEMTVQQCFLFVLVEEQVHEEDPSWCRGFQCPDWWSGLSWQAFRLLCAFGWGHDTGGPHWGPCTNQVHTHTHTPMPTISMFR